MMSVVFKILSMCVLFFLCCVCGLVSLISWLFFMVFNLWIGPGFIFEPCSKFVIFQ